MTAFIYSVGERVKFTYKPKATTAKLYTQCSGCTGTVTKRIPAPPRVGGNMYGVRIDGGWDISAYEDELEIFHEQHQTHHTY